MVETTVWLAEKLSAEGEKTLEFFQSLDEEDWQVLLYSDGAEWHVREILAHFVVTETGIPLLIRDVLRGGDGSPEGFDLDEFNRREVQRLENLGTSLLLEKFAELRRRTILLVKSMKDADLHRTGRHPYLGEVPLIDMVKLLYRHTQLHQRDIRRSLAGYVQD